MNGKVSRARPAIHTLDQSTAHLICSITVGCSEVDILLIDTPVEQGIYTLRTVDGPKVTTVLDAVAQPVSRQHALIARAVPDDTVERMPERIFDLTIDCMSLNVGVVLSTDRVGNLVVIATIPAGSRVEDVFVRVQVVWCTFVMALDDGEEDKLGILSLSRTLVVFGANVRCVAVVCVQNQRFSWSWQR